VSAFVALLRWDSSAPSPTALGGIENLLTPWKGDGIRVAGCPGAALGISLLSADTQRRDDVQPFVDSIAKVAVVADCRLDNREALRRDLSLDRDAANSTLILEGYRRWGEDLCNRLRGDFACVVWDWGRQRGLAFRDPLGVKPLFYSAFSGGLAVASDTELVLGMVGSSRSPDDQAIIEHLLWEYASPNRTFWTSISRLPGGHSLLVGPSEARAVQQYWKPDAQARRFSAPTEVYEEFRRLLFQSIERRLDSDSPVLAQLSGGLDSSLIVCVADRIRRSSGFNASSLGTVSQRFPGSSWDEGEFIGAVTEWTDIPNTEWDGSNADFRDLVRPPLAGPGMGASRSSGSVGDLEIAKQRGVRVLVSGEGGDQLGAPSGIADDVIESQPFVFAVETLMRPDLSLEARLGRGRRLARSCVPLSLRRALAIHHYRLRLPDWLEPRWRSLAGDIVATFYPTQFESRFEYNVQRAHWHDLTSRRLGTALDLQQRVGCKYGVELRFPFLDQDLVEFVLSIPPQFWPRESGAARLHRDAIGDLLPPRIRERRSKAIFSGAIRQRLLAAAPQLDALFYGGKWLSSKYVRRTQAQILLREAVPGTSQGRGLDHWRTWLAVTTIATLEAWLRTVLGYATPRGGASYD